MQTVGGGVGSSVGSGVDSVGSGVDSVGSNVGSGVDSVGSGVLPELGGGVSSGCPFGEMVGTGVKQTSSTMQSPSALEPKAFVQHPLELSKRLTSSEGAVSPHSTRTHFFPSK